jgi:protein involved in polysaccharide export with SLBB domain
MFNTKPHTVVRISVLYARDSDTVMMGVARIGVCPLLTALALVLVWLPAWAQLVAAPPVTAVTRLSPGMPQVAAPGSNASVPELGGVRRPLVRVLDREPAQAAEAGEFERLATKANGGKLLARFGSELRRDFRGLDQIEAPARVPAQYILQVGDEVTVNVWGSVDAEWLLRVDRAGRLTLPRVGPIVVAGASAGELEQLIRSRLNRVFKSFEVSAAVTEISPLRVHVTGFVERPGEYIVPGLTTISRALSLAQGPSAGGSFRRVRLVRNDTDVVMFDLYTLLAKGSRRDDVLLQPDDVLHVEAAGPQVALYGSVNRAAVFEFLPGESVGDLLRFAGGFSSLADRTRLTLERLANRDGVGAVQVSLPADEGMRLVDGDMLQALSVTVAAVPSQLRNKRVRVEGEVLRPGEYVLPRGVTLTEAVQMAGGPTESAFLFGAELRRERVRLTQEVNYERALKELEAEIGRTSAVRSSPTEQAAAARVADEGRQFLDRLRARRPEGRMVLDITPQSTQLPALELEDGDIVLLPPRSQSVGVFGSVYSTGSFIHDGKRDLGFYLRRAGGPTAGADHKSSFVVRADGSVVSARQDDGWSSISRFESLPALPGDTLFVPEKLDRVSFVEGAKDWTQIFYQLGLGLLGLKALR